MNYSKVVAFFLCSATALLVSGCGAGTIDATIGGSIGGLAGGTTVGLLNNGSDPISVGSNGSFNFDVQIASGSSYNVTVGTQPIGETCTVTNPSGTVDSSGDDVTNVTVICNQNITATNEIIGTVNGLTSGNSVTLLNEGGDQLQVTANGIFAFSAPQASGTPYDVTVSVNPTGQTCTVANGSGVVPTSGTIPNVVVTC
jgi:hypothetical protein